MTIQRSSNTALPSAEERHEWASFLALLPMFDLQEIDREKYQRCLRAVWRSSNRECISRDELKARAGLGFEGAALGLDLLLAKLVRDRILAPVEPRPYRFRMTERRCHPDFTYASDDEQSLTPGVRVEQSIRLRTIHDLEQRIGDPRCTPRHEVQLREKLGDLRKIYQAAWFELENAIGTECACECRCRMESQSLGASNSCCCSRKSKALLRRNQDAESERSGGARAGSCARRLRHR